MNKIKNKKRLTFLTVLALITFLVGAAFASAVGMLDIRGEVHVAGPEEAYVVWSQISFGTYGQVEPAPVDWRTEANTVHTFGPPINNLPALQGIVGGISPAFFTDDGVFARAVITDERGRTRQRIVWEVYFDEDSLVTVGTESVAFASLHAEMLNQALQPALVYDVRIYWEGAPIILVDAEAVLAADFGLHLNGFFLETILAPSGLTLQPAGTGPAPAANSFHRVAFTIAWEGLIPDDFSAPANAPYRPVAGDDPNILFGHVGTLVIEFAYGPTAP